MAASGTCANPLCVCSPCTCGDDCRCRTGRLGELEQQVMDVLWDRPGDELTGRAVADALDGYAYTTVATVLDRLSHKGLVARRLAGRSARFAATDTRAGWTARLMRQALETTADPVAVLVRFAETASPSEAATLRKALARPGVDPGPA